jgi:shikimate kinase
LLKGLNLYLIGMMGAGKTSVGSLLAQHLNYRFFDTDALIEQVARQSINEIFANSGEDAFRQLESQVLGEISAYTKLTIATGGGIILRRENWSYLHHGLIVWLDVPVEVLIARLAEDTTRPLLQNADPKGELERLLEQRQRLYAQADIQITVEAGETPEQVARRAIDLIPSVLKSGKLDKAGF